MNIVILLILSSVVAASIFLIAFLWAAASGQYDDVHTPAVRMLFEDKPSAPSMSHHAVRREKKNTTFEEHHGT